MNETRPQSNLAELFRHSHFFNRRKDVGILLCLIIFGGLYLSMYLKLGWCPDDAGVVGQQAFRFLKGEMPHRDFHETYTGGLTVLNAVVFKFFGVNIVYLLRLVLCFFLLSLGCVFLFMRSSVSAGLSILVSLLVLVWAFPNCVSALPSWYVVSLWCFGVLLFDCHRLSCKRGEEKGGWLVGVGVCGALATLMKINGLILLGGVSLSICQMSIVRTLEEDEIGKAIPWGAILIGGILFLHASASAYFFACLPSLGNFVNLFVPNLALNIYLWVILKNAPYRQIDAGVLFRRISLVLGGFVLTLIFPLMWFLSHSDFESLWAGLIHRPSIRMQSVSSPFPSILLSGWAIPACSLFIAGVWGWGKTKDRTIAWVLGLLSLPLFMKAIPIESVVLAVRLALPFIVIAALCYLHGYRDERLGAETKVELFLPLSLLVTCSYIQFPSAYISYFFYLSPLFFITMGKWGGTVWKLPRTGFVSGLGLVLFGMIELNPSKFYGKPYESLNLPTASLSVPLEQSRVWGPLIKRVQFLSPIEYSPIYAGPDCPEIYFLSMRRNPTKILYEVFEDQKKLAENILETVDKEKCQLVVINLAPNWSKRFPVEFHQALINRFMQVEKYGQFLLYFKRR